MLTTCRSGGHCEHLTDIESFARDSDQVVVENAWYPVATSLLAEIDSLLSDNGAVPGPITLKQYLQLARCESPRVLFEERAAAAAVEARAEADSRAIDLAHAAFAKLPHDEIRPDHVAGIHRLLLCIGVRGGSHPTASHVMLTNVPELPEVEFVRRRLAPVMARKRFERVSVRRPDLRLPFPVRFSARLTGETALAVRRRAKYLLVPLSSGETLLMHLGMSGSFRIERHLREPDDPRHDHVVFHMSSGAVVTFNDPRRFGFMDLLAADALATHPVLSRLGPEPLSAEFDAFVLARACKGRKTPLKIALLDQRVVAGLGNIYAAEALHVARLSPNRRASTIATASGAPRESARRLAAAIKQVLTEAIDRQSKAVYRSARFRVYDREAEPCRRGRCGGTIRRRTQAGRSTFFCPVCQR